MKPDEVTPGMIITNGSSAMIASRRIQHDPHWRTSGWNGMAVGLERFGGGAGLLMTFVADYLLASWRPLALDWTPVVGGELEERYVNAGDARMVREVRKAGGDE